MKIYETSTAPSPRRVRIFLAEKGLLDKVTFEQLDIQAGENITPEFRLKNPIAKVPVLELDDGSYISESVAICRYFEALYPENPLMGVTPKEQAEIEMWQRRCEIYFFNIVGMGFQHTTGYFADRMQPNKEWGEQCVKGAAKFFRVLEAQLSQNEFIAGDSYSIADITALVTVDFARVIKVRISEDMPNVLRWYEAVKQRPSAKV